MSACMSIFGRDIYTPQEIIYADTLENFRRCADCVCETQPIVRQFRREEWT